MATPCAFSSAMTRNRMSTSVALSAEVGSSMMRMLRVLRQGLGDLDDLLLADAQFADRRVRVGMSCSSRRISARRACLPAPCGR